MICCIIGEFRLSSTASAAIVLKNSSGLRISSS